jgi:hypothetical protein
MSVLDARAIAFLGIQGFDTLANDALTRYMVGLDDECASTCLGLTTKTRCEAAQD